jgi:hypothetical protein
MRNDWIQEYLEQYDFEELDPKIQASVLAEMSKEEYMETRSLLLATISSSALNLSAPPQKIEQNLSAAFREKYPQNVGFWQQPIHLWKVAAALLLLLGASFALQLFLKTQPADRIVYKEQLKVERDTLVERIYIRDTIYKEIPIQLPPQQLKPSNVETPQKPLDFAEVNGDSSQQELVVLEMNQLPNLDSNALKNDFRTSKSRYDSSLYSLSVGQVL